jgi:hypothetical protein
MEVHSVRVYIGIDLTVKNSSQLTLNSGEGGKKKMKRHPNKCKVLVMAALLTLTISVPAAMATEEEIVGAVIDTGVGYAIIADSGEYLVLNNDLSKYVGDTVAVSGNVEVGVDTLSLDHINTIRVLSKRDLINPSGALPKVAG